MTGPDVHKLLAMTAHRPYALPSRPWRLAQRWNDLLFAHWPVAVEALTPLLPAGLEVDTYDGYGWVGVIPFWMDHVRTRWVGERTFGVPTTRTFAELNLRTYVRSRVSGKRGVYFFALDCESPLAVLGARTLFHLPYFPAAMERAGGVGGMIGYRSRRQLTRREVRFAATYGPAAGAVVEGPSQPGSFEHFACERYCLFTRFLGRTLVGEIHHAPWPLVRAEAEFMRNEVPAAHGIRLPERAPVLHYAASLEVLLWSLKVDGVDLA